MSGSTGKSSHGLNQARAKARRLALQALYQWDLSGTDLKLIEQQFRESEEFPGVDDEYFQELLHQVPARLDAVEAGLADCMQLTWAELDPVERAVLRLASYELQSRPDIPYRVVINEAVNLAKKFGAEQAHKFVNGVLDQAARQLRPYEQAK
jgi:N utilization substance protein B